MSRATARADSVIPFPSGTVASITQVRPLLEPDKYQLAFVRYETVRQFKAEKVVLWFTVVTPGPAFGAELPRYYNAQKIGTKVRSKGGGFSFGPCSAFYREYCAVFGAPHRADRISMDRYLNTVILGEVGTVTSGHDQTEIPDGARYSVVRRLLRLEAGK